MCWFVNYSYSQTFIGTKDAGMQLQRGLHINDLGGHYLLNAKK